ncbi:hypothetical protein BLNAU_5152 [Blattamonas nauphoetae]|uniref:IPT/TIG domain-containing protein n=1 Tax=Blattamonas nauphoetae TaxID=2049346 RepID=A0ABQ9Y892_9EUKA|nr:hypothetical protein BLNAU_5152 [Blattamonas nauphoetae]
MDDSAEVTVPGSNLEISQSDLYLGTGPLVDFGEFRSTQDLSTVVTTTLTNTVILNTTSTSAPRLFTPLPTISQSVIGCSIAESTNHFAGTATLNVNHQQQFSAINTTVITCHDSLQSNADYTDTNYSSRPNIYTGSYSYTRCLFKGCYTNYSSGAAIGIGSQGTLSVTDCSFVDCYSASASVGKGGAICFYEYMTSYDGPKTTITRSSVANCRAHWGSAVCLSNNLRITLSEFVVENCSKFETALSNKKTGLGALYIMNATESVRVSNVVFSHCHNDHAGAVFLNTTTASHSFDSIAFRGSSVEKGDDSRDFATTLPSTSDFASMFSNCDSTSFGADKPLFAVGTTDSEGNLTITDSLVDIIAGVATQKKLTIASFSLTEDETEAALAICTVTVNETVNGKMLILLDNTLLKENTKTKPTIQRLVCLTFDEEGSTTASTSLTYGSIGILQASLSDYLIMTASMIGWKVTPSVNNPKCVLSSTGNEIDVTIHGSNFEDGSYEVVVQKVGENSPTILNFERQFERLFCSAVAYPEESAQLEYNTEYSIVSVKCDGQTLNQSFETIVFTTPVAPVRLIGIGEVTFTEGKKAVNLPFTSSGLSPSTKYKMVVDSVPKEPESSHSLTLNFTTDSSGSLTSSAQTVYPIVSTLLSFGTKYKVRTFTPSSGSTFIALTPIEFSIPDEPSRLTGVPISYESNETVAVITRPLIHEINQAETEIDRSQFRHSVHAIATCCSFHLSLSIHQTEKASIREEYGEQRTVDATT